MTTSHSLGAGQLIGFIPVHVPLEHTSVCVHALESAQALPVVGPHVPLTAAPAATLHAEQSFVPPAHATLQHTPSTQLPL